MKIYFKLTGLIVIILSLFVVNSCTGANKNTAITKEEPQNIEIHQDSPNSSEQPLPAVKDNSSNLNSFKKMEQYVVTNSDKVIGWKQLTAKVLLCEMTDNGNGMSWHKLEVDRTIEYSIHFPGSWTLNGTVFEDANNNKIAELFPVTLLKDELAFLDYKTSEKRGDKQLSKESISVNKYKGTKIILKTDAESITWFPNIYLLSDGSYGFGMALYSRSEERDEVEDKLFNDIIHTFKFNL